MVTSPPMLMPIFQTPPVEAENSAARSSSTVPSPAGSVVSDWTVPSIAVAAAVKVSPVFEMVIVVPEVTVAV